MMDPNHELVIGKSMPIKKKNYVNLRILEYICVFVLLLPEHIYFCKSSWDPNYCRQKLIPSRDARLLYTKRLPPLVHLFSGIITDFLKADYTGNTNKIRQTWCSKASSLIATTFVSFNFIDAANVFIASSSKFILAQSWPKSVYNCELFGNSLFKHIYF